MITAVLMALLGAGCAVGLLLIRAGWRGVDPAQHGRARYWWTQHRSDLTSTRLLAAVATGVVIGAFTGWVVGAILAALAVWGLPRVLSGDRHHTQRLEQIDAIATWIQLLRGTLDSAAGLEQAILATAPIAPSAIRPQIGTLAARLQHGDRLVASLEALSHELADPTVDYVVLALKQATQYPAGQLGVQLSELARDAQERASMRRRVAAARRSNRTTVRIIVGTTLALAGMLLIFNSRMLAGYASPTGQLMLGVIGGIFALGFAWLNRVAQFTEPQRIVDASPTTTTSAATTPPAVKS